MANEEHLKLARQGRDAWNKWRKENPDEPADFSGTDFTLPENKDISFAGFEFGDDANFERVVFGDLPFDWPSKGSPNGGSFFQNAVFGNRANFFCATFGDRAVFDIATFGSGTTFSGAIFGEDTLFTNAMFESDATFDGAIFNGGILFDGAVFGGLANFSGATFCDWATFNLVTFLGWVSFRGWDREKLDNFWNSTLSDLSDNVRFKREAIFERSASKSKSFRNLSFLDAIFSGSATFADRTFEDEADFAGARFNQPPDFLGTKNRERLNLAGVRFGGGGEIFRLASYLGTIAKWRRLRGIAKETYATDAERDLFILERMAERGVLWKSWWYSGWKSRLFGWWRPASATVLMFLYWALSNCGRSMILPFLWFVAANVGAFFVYGQLADIKVTEALWNLTLANLLPFGTLAKPLAEHAAVELFHGGIMPPGVGLTAIFQGVVNALLIFLLALASRNHFKVK